MPLYSYVKSHGEDGLLAQVHHSQAPVNWQMKRSGLQQDSTLFKASFMQFGK